METLWSLQTRRYALEAGIRRTRLARPSKLPWSVAWPKVCLQAQHAGSEDVDGRKGSREGILTPHNRHGFVAGTRTTVRRVLWRGTVPLAQQPSWWARCSRTEADRHGNVLRGCCAGRHSGPQRFTIGLLLSQSGQGSL